MCDNQKNVGFICSTLQVLNGKGNHLAMRFIDSDFSSRDYSFNDLEYESNRVANLLNHLNINAGDVVIVFLPKIPDLFFAFLGILKCKCIAGIVFSSLGDEALLDRLIDSNAKCILTKKSLLKKIMPNISKLPYLENILLIDEDDLDHLHVDFKCAIKKIYSYKKIIKEMSGNFQVPITTVNTPSVLHYTSGSTGKPKGVLHVHGGVFLQNNTFRHILGVNQEHDDIYWCTADQGWVTGVTYGIIAPWSSGVSQIQFAGAYRADSWFKILEQEKVNVWYTAPTALRMIMMEKENFFDNFNLSHLKHISSVGEPLNPEIIYWAKRVLKKDVYDTWFQTETGAIMIANRPDKKIKPGSMGLPSASLIVPEIISDAGEILGANTEGNLCLKAPFSTMFVTYLNNPEIYENKFKNGYYYSGDRAYRDEDGYFWFIGRNDDVINTAGHLVSPFEVESALLEMNFISESAVIGVPDELFFEKIVAYVCLKDGYIPSKDLELKIRIHVANKVSSTATPQQVIFLEDIPKNNSGKILRRILKKRYLGEDVGDISTIQGGS